MTLPRLSPAVPLPVSVLAPGYDRDALQPGIVHFGIGAFHRAHQAIYTQRALQAAFGPWGIVAVNLRSPEPVEALAEQEGLYSVLVAERERDTAEVVGATIGWICAAEQGEQVLARLADPQIRVVTLTVSEKAYGLHPVTSGLDPAHPAVASDLANPHSPVGAIGFLVEGLARRRATNVPPYTVLCCDNLPSNGHVVRRLVLDMAERRDPALAAWIADNGAFPCSMVDRIVPAATEETRTRAAELLGAQDRLAIETEPFTQWIIENRFVSGRPHWEAGGALFVENVEPYEKMKLRLLNGAHTLVAHLGILNGLEHVRDVMAVPALAAAARAHMEAAVTTLDPVPGIDLSAYIHQLLERFANPRIAHRNIQIAMDTSQKLPQRLLAPAMDALAKGSDGAAFAKAVGLWFASLRMRMDCNDPRREELIAAAGNSNAADPSAAFFEIEGLFPHELVAARSWRDLVNAELRQWDKSSSV
jgi:fructuronate reductase